jgi:anthranilate phosphoribosyltransferase
MDEVTTTGKTFGVKLINGKLSEFELEPKTFGIDEVSIEKLKGGDSHYNANEIMQLLNGEKGPFRDIVKMNAICSILASDLTNDINEASEMVTESIDSKSALEKLNLLKQISNT